jgi:hypothetical protein
MFIKAPYAQYLRPIEIPLPDFTSSIFAAYLERVAAKKLNRVLK